MLVGQKGQTVYEVSEVYDDKTGVLRMRQIRLDGKRHAPSDDTPSHAAFDERGRPLFLEWHSEDVLHRVEGPSQITLNPKNGVHVLEVFERSGQPRPNHLGPYTVHRDKDTGEVTFLVGADGNLLPLNSSNPEP